MEAHDKLNANEINVRILNYLFSPSYQSDNYDDGNSKIEWYLHMHVVLQDDFKNEEYKTEWKDLLVIRDKKKCSHCNGLGHSKTTCDVSIWERYIKRK